MLPDYPNNLDEQQEQQYATAWWNIFYLIKGSIQAILIAVCLVFICTLFDIDPINDWKKNAVVASSNTPYISNKEGDDDRVEKGIHIATGLKYDENFELVRAQCTACHSGKLVAQNRATREGWQQMIRWMQATQGLWDLGKKEPIILDYLAKHYAPQEVGRRANLEVADIEWYILEMEE